MPEIRTAINITDGLSPAFKSMSNALNIIISNFETLQKETNRPINTASFTKAREEIQKANVALNKMQESARNAAQQQQNLNQQMQGGLMPATNLLGKIKQLGSAYLGYLGAAKAMDFIRESMDLSNVQTNVENQLRAVLSNVGATEKAFDELTKYASDIQSRGIYGDEAMIAGAAEFATYMSDTDAIKVMMDTLSNYAMGMTGGGAVDSRQMTQFATQLGMALNGTYAGLSKKGFKLTDAQKEIIKNGTDMEKALVLQSVIGDSWQDLYDQMSNTPQGKIIQLQNAIGDLKEEAGAQFNGMLASFATNIFDNFDQVKNVIKGLTNTFSILVGVIGTGAKIALSVASAIYKNWDAIAPVVGIATMAYIANSAATMAMAFSMEKLTFATLKATAAQWGLNMAFWANPIVMTIGAIVGALYLGVAAFNYFTGAGVSATGIIAGTFAFMGAKIYNVVAFIANTFVSLCEFLRNVFVDPLTAIQNLFIDIWNGVVEVVGQSVAMILNLIGKLPGFKQFANFKADDLKIERKTIVGGIDNSAHKFGYKNLKDSFSNAYDRTKAFTDNPAGAFGFEKFKMNSNPQLDKIADATGETAKNTGKADKDIQLLREIAEREQINRFTTAEIKIDMTNYNSVNNEMDLDGVVSMFADKLQEQMHIAAESVHI